MREGPPIQSCITPNPNCSQPQAKSSFWKILAISAYRSGFCAGTRQYLPGNSFRMNSLDRCPKSVEENDPSLEGKSLFQKILRVSPCGSRFCTHPARSTPSKSLRMNILEKSKEKKWRRPSPNIPCPIPPNHPPDQGIRRARPYEFSPGALHRESTSRRKTLDAACCIL